MPGVFMSTMKHEMPSCFGRSGAVRARQMPHCAWPAIDVHTFWPLSTQPPSTRVARVESAARSEPAPGSLNSWHQLISPRSVGGIQRSCCSGGAEHDERRERPCTDADVGALHLGGPELLLDHEQLERLGVAAPRAGPARREVAVGGEPFALLARRVVLDLVEQGPHLGAVHLGLGPEVDREPAARAALHLARGAHAPLVGRAHELVQRDRAAQVEVRVVLPREADAAERLHAVLAVQERGVERERGGGRDREAAAVVGVVHGAGRVPHRGACELGARQHVGAAVLHALELPDRAAELHAHLRVLGGGVDAPLRDTDRLRGEQHRGDVAHALRREAGQPPVGGRVHLAEVELGRRAGSGRCSATPSRPPRPRRARTSSPSISHTITSASVPPSTGRAPVERDRPRALARRQLRQPLLGDGAARFLEHRGRDRGRRGTARARTPGPAPRSRRPARPARSRRRRAPRRRGARASPARTARPRTRAGPRSPRRPPCGPRRAGCSCRRTAGPPAVIPRALR